MPENQTTDKEQLIVTNRLISAYLRGINILPQTHWGTSLALGTVLLDPNPPYTFEQFLNYELTQSEIEATGKALNIMHEKYGIKKRYSTEQGDIRASDLQTLWVTAKGFVIKRILNFASVIPGLSDKTKSKNIITRLKKAFDDDYDLSGDFKRLGDVLNEDEDSLNMLRNIFEQTNNFLSSGAAKKTSSEYRTQVSSDYINHKKGKYPFRFENASSLSASFKFSEENLIDHLRKTLPDLNWNKYYFKPN